MSRAVRRLPQPRFQRNLGLTRRALVFFAVIGVLALSYANSLRIYLSQQRDTAIAQQQIEERSQRAAELEGQLQRWRDPDFVRSEARTRLGWVMPGETGYRVIGRDGQVISGNVEVKGLSSAEGGDMAPTWWDRMAGSIALADGPPNEGR